VAGTGSGIASRTGASGRGGSVTLSAPRIEIASGGAVSARSEGGFNELGGFMERIRDYLRPAPLTATGNAGRVTLEASHLVHLDAGEITTSVGVATGGEITIDPVFVILEHGSRSPGRRYGSRGQIQIAADNFIHFPTAW
jgi:hypothetical protein